MKRRPLRWALLPLLLAGAGCATIQPKTTALEEIHEAYREEFREVVVPKPQARPTVAGGQPGFAETLQQIRGFRSRFGEESAPAAHVDVLEGMIYLQTGRFGMARLLINDIAAAAERLKSGSGRYTRDRLFARAFPHLVEGWELAVKANDNQSPTGGGDRLAAAGDAIAQLLTGLDADRLASPQADQGAIYLATNAAIFWAWADAILLNDELLAKGRDLIGCFLSETEKKASGGAADLSDAPPGRLRYLAWYRDLHERAGGATSDITCPRSD